MPGCTFTGSTYAAAALWQEESKVEYGPNPKRTGTKSFDRYEAYRKAATVGEALKLGSLPDDLLFDFEKGHLKVFEPLRQKPLDLFEVKSIDDELTYTDKALARWVHLATVSQDSKSKLIQKQVDDSLRKSTANRRRLTKIETAKALEVKDVDDLADTTGLFESPIMMARRSHANEQAKDMLKVVEKEGRSLTDYEVLQVLRLWDFRENVARQNVMKEGEKFVYSDTCGIVSMYTGKIAVKEECRRYPDFGRLLNRWLKDNLPKDLGTDFTYTSININKNYAARVHRDGNNVGPSLIKAFGDFSGGELHYYPEDDRSCSVDALDVTESAQVDISKGLLLFDGKRAHFVDDFKGERYSLVFFTCPRFERISEDGMEYMRAAEFPYPTEDSMSKVTNLLRKPKCKEATEAQEASLHNAPFMFWPHASREHSENETHAEEYWKVQGLRSRIVSKGHGNVSFENGEAPAKAAWNVSQSVGLPSEPARKDLVLTQFTNKNDAVEFLNKAESEVPEAVVEAGCCAVKSKWARKATKEGAKIPSEWFVLFKKGMKSQAMATFGLESAPDSSSLTDRPQGRPKKPTEATASATEEGSQEGQQPVTTPSKKQKLFPASAEKSKQKRLETCAADLQVEGAVEVREKSNSGNTTNVADPLVAKKGSVKQTDDHTGSQVGSLQEKPMTKKELLMQKLRKYSKAGKRERKAEASQVKAESLKQKPSKIRKVPSAPANTQGAEVERKDGEPMQNQSPAASLDPKKNLDQKRGKIGKIKIFKTSTASPLDKHAKPKAKAKSKAKAKATSTAASSSAKEGSEMQQEMGSGPEQQQQIVEHKSEFRENARVRMHGLKAVQYNGRTAVLQKFDADDGRWVVTLDNGRDTIRVKEENMVAHAAEEEASLGARDQTSRQSVAPDGPPAKRQKVVTSEIEHQKYDEGLAAHCLACFADAQIEYKADGKTQKSHPDSYQRYAGYAQAKTIREALSLGATSEDIVYDFNFGVLKIITLRHTAPQVQTPENVVEG